jgi:hypothetical protein
VNEGAGSAEAAAEGVLHCQKAGEGDALQQVSQAVTAGGKPAAGIPAGPLAGLKTCPSAGSQSRRGMGSAVRRMDPLGVL